MTWLWIVLAVWLAPAAVFAIPLTVIAVKGRIKDRKLRLK